MLALHLVLVVCAAVAVQTAGWTGLRISLPVLAIGAALLSVGLAKSWLPDGMAHLVAVVTAAAASLLAVGISAGELGGTLLARMELIGRRSLDWYFGRGIERHDSLLLSLLMGALIWLLAYLATWTLFRRGWLFASLLLPGFLLLVNLGYAPVPAKAPLIVYLLVSGILAARYHLYRRQRQWARWGIPFPTAMGTRFFVTGAGVALLAVVVGWLAPRSLAHAPLDPLLDRVEQPLLTAQERMTGWLDDSARGSERDQIAEDARFTSFDDSFSIGGPLQLTDTPAVLLQADQAAYLAAHRYDTYSGRGWSSSVEDTFDGRAADGQNYSPEMTFQAGQDVPLSDGVRGQRTPVSGAVTVLSPRGNVVLTNDTFVTADVPTSVRLSWRRVDQERFPIDGRSIGDLPPDLQRIAVLLARARYSPGAADSSLPDREPDLAGQIQREQLELSHRFLTVGWDVDDQGRVLTLIVSGQLPVYDDVEAVFAREAIQPGAPYAVTGLASTAMPDQLRAAGDDYPAHVAQRYLQLPTTITPRTVQLANALTQDTDNAFDAASEIEEYLRRHISYVETVPVPPANQDVVDYVLFDDPRGYCEYYATAMAVMLRTQGIPARVVVGFYPGPFDQARNGFLYRERNAHAWVEVFFPTYGWIAFEPTASQPTRDYGEDAGEPPVESTPPVETSTTGEVTPPAEAFPASTPSAAPPATVSTSGEDGDNSGLLAMAVVAVSAVLIGAGVLLWLRPLRGLSPGDALYFRLLRFGRFVGLRPDHATTPHEFAVTLGEAVPVTRRPAMQIVEVYELSRYGGQEADERLLRAARRGWAELRRQSVPARLQMRRWHRDHGSE